MRICRILGIACLSVMLISAADPQQRPRSTASPVTAPTIPVSLGWTPPDLAALVESAEVKNSFVFDRTMLSAAAALIPDSEADARRSIRKLDGIGVHLYRFRDEGMIDPALVDRVRQAYHAHGWEHMVTPSEKDVLSRGTKTDLWLVVDGITVRGGTLLVVTPRSVSLVTFAGDLNPIDLMHLRGHFGIPRFSGDKFQDTPVQ